MKKKKDWISILFFCLLKKKLQKKRAVNQVLFGSKIKTIARETPSQIALRNYSKESGGMVSIYIILLKGEYMQTSTYF